MSLSTGQAAMIRHLQGMPGRPNIVYPNGPDAPLPRYVVQVSGGSQRTITMKGQTDATAEIMVRVETASGKLSGENDDLVAALVARFAPGTRFEGMAVVMAPMPRPAMPDSSVYAVPVIVTVKFTF